MLTLIAIAATTSIMTLAITTVGIAALSIKNMIDNAPESESFNLQAAGFDQLSRAAVARCAA